MPGKLEGFSSRAEFLGLKLNKWGSLLRILLTDLRSARAEWARLGEDLKRRTVQVATALFEQRIPSVSIAQLLALTTAQLTALITGDVGPQPRPGRPRRVPATMRLQTDAEHHAHRLF